MQCTPPNVLQPFNVNLLVIREWCIGAPCMHVVYVAHIVDSNSECMPLERGE
jgi:hypothetical protein